MPIVQTPSSLLDPHHQLIRECQAYAVDHWQLHYNQTILNTVGYLQLLQNSSDKPLLGTALARTLESLQKLFNKNPAAPQNEHYACFSAALMLDLGQPLTDLAVYTGTGAKATRWNPLIQETNGKVGTPYDSKRTEAKLPHSTFTPTIAVKLLPETASKALRHAPDLLHSWIQTLEGRQGNDIAKIVNPTATVGRNYVSPEERVEPFIGYLRNEIRAHRTNAPQYSIHLTLEGVFLRSPDIFQDYDVTHSTTIQQNLTATSYVIHTQNDEPFWKCISISDGIW